MELNKLLAGFYERDLRAVIEELHLFNAEADLWKTTGSITNSSGNLVLHLIGGMNHHIGKTLGGIDYVRNRDLEFSQKNVPKIELISGLEAQISVINQTLEKLTVDDLKKDFPVFFDEPGTSVEYVLIQLLIHLNYHRGQINYLRRALE